MFEHGISDVDRSRCLFSAVSWSISDISSIVILLSKGLLLLTLSVCVFMCVNDLLASSCKVTVGHFAEEVWKWHHGVSPSFRVIY